jgi:mRNA interferase RelE/StbE
MIEYSKELLNNVRTLKIPGRVFVQIHHCFQAIEKVGDMTIFDVKEIKGNYRNVYYRLRKGPYRAVFFFERDSIKAIALEHKSEAYRKCQS